MFNHYKIKIHFAHRTFSWRNEAKGNAAVHVVIFGFASFDTNKRTLYEYFDIRKEPNEISVKNINLYLVECSDSILIKRTKSIGESPIMTYGSMPNDGGFLLLNQEEKDNLINKEPAAVKYIKPLVMGEELINSIPRYCLWLEGVPPDELNSLKYVTQKIKSVFDLRNASSRETTRNLAQFPSLFGESRQPISDYIALPRVSSVNRNFIPIAILSKDTIAGDKFYTINSNSRYHFGIITSTMHMSWMRVTSGRLKSDYSYFSQLTYNNFPWPLNPSDKQTKAIETAAQKVLDARLAFPKSSLADLYEPLTMPPILNKAHNELDKAVDLAYRPLPFTTEAKRMEYLFELYEKYTADLFTVEKSKRLKHNK